jgi:hypothetical protein
MDPVGAEDLGISTIQRTTWIYHQSRENVMTWTSLTIEETSLITVHPSNSFSFGPWISSGICLPETFLDVPIGMIRLPLYQTAIMIIPSELRSSVSSKVHVLRVSFLLETLTKMPCWMHLILHLHFTPTIPVGYLISEFIISCLR